MTTTLNDLPVLQHHNFIRVTNSGKQVSNHETCSSLHQVIHSLLNDQFRSGIDGARCFVEYQNGLFGYGSPGNN